MAGFLYFLTFIEYLPTGFETVSRAKKIFTSMAIGLLIIYSAWFLVGLFLRTVGLASWVENIYRDWWQRGIFVINCPSFISSSLPSPPTSPPTSSPTSIATCEVPENPGLSLYLQQGKAPLDTLLNYEGGFSDLLNQLSQLEPPGSKGLEDSALKCSSSKEGKKLIEKTLNCISKKYHDFVNNELEIYCLEEKDYNSLMEDYALKDHQTECLQKGKCVGWFFSPCEKKEEINVGDCKKIENLEERNKCYEADLETRKNLLKLTCGGADTDFPMIFLNQNCLQRIKNPHLLLVHEIAHQIDIKLGWASKSEEWKNFWQEEREDPQIVGIMLDALSEDKNTENFLTEYILGVYILSSPSEYLAYTVQLWCKYKGKVEDITKQPVLRERLRKRFEFLEKVGIVEKKE